METLIISRNEGKTTKLIKKSAKSGDYIVCFNQEEAYRIQNEAQNMKLNIPLPITYDEFLHKRYCGRRIHGFLFDNADMFLQSLSGVPINIITVSS
jgi:hypothetical protein